MKKSRLLGAVCAVWMLMFAFSYTAHATMYIESGDAGGSIATAQSLPGGTTVIRGDLFADADDEDMFGFYWGGGAFQADTFGTGFDTQLFLFDSTGTGVWANDDAASGGVQSEIIDASLTAGSYFIAVSIFNSDPLDGSGNRLFDDCIFGCQVGPLPGVGVLASWSGSTAQGDVYAINMAYPTSTPEIPVPAAVWLFGSGLLGLIGVARRKKA